MSADGEREKEVELLAGYKQFSGRYVILQS